MQATPTTAIYAYQIYYDRATHSQLDPGFFPLDNMLNPRPDWREYWPIKQFFLSRPKLDETGYYGFLSPKFKEKTGLSSQDVLAFMHRHSGSPDIFSFSPYFDQMAVFINMFEQGNAHHAGLMECSREFLTKLGIDPLLLEQVGHSRNTIFCNYFIAKPTFWRHWLAINEALFALCEENSSRLAQRLNAGTDHAGTHSCPLKVFLIERIASLLLATGSYTHAAFNPYKLPRTNSPAAKLNHELLIADALKQTYAATRAQEYLDAFIVYRHQISRQLAGEID
jgi:hypothetical protein